MNCKDEARSLVAKLARSCVSGEPIGNMSTTIYDTAWVSLVSKDSGKGRVWFLPETFYLLLELQLPEGGWPSYASEVDGILNSLAALLSLYHHRRLSYMGISNPPDLDERIVRATEFLRTALQAWKIENCDHVGFEVIIPALLRLLEKENVHFSFPARAALLERSALKLAKFDPQVLYGRFSNTLVHSLEALVGLIDFDRVQHHKQNGSMLASPASTAAYLMNASVWDSEAETYLLETYQMVRQRGEEGFPSAFPSTQFDIAWVMSTLLGHGYSAADLGPESVTAIVNQVESVLAAQNNLLGFAPGLLPDADDTAKSIYTLYLLGRTSASVDPMIEKFFTGEYFRSYALETTLSFSANCNVLLALLQHPTPSNYITEITKSISNLCELWMQGKCQDKWNISEHYSMMLLSEVFRSLLCRRDHSFPNREAIEPVLGAIPIVLSEILTKTLLTQEVDGSWGSQSCEVTAYGTLILSSLERNPWFSTVQPKIQEALIKSRRFLSDNFHRWTELNYLWVEKVTYASPVLTRAYCLAALSECSADNTWNMELFEIALSPKKVAYFTDFFAKLPLFAETSQLELQLALIEAYQHLPELESKQKDVFPEQGMKSKYLEYIPITWTASSLLCPLAVSPFVKKEMMWISMLNYQVDEYMEVIASKHDAIQLNDIIEDVVKRQLACSQKSSLGPGAPNLNGNSNLQNGHLQKRPRLALSADSGIEEVQNTLGRFAHAILSHKAVRRSALSTRARLARELRVFLRAHVAQKEASQHYSDYSSSGVPTAWSPEFSYHEWATSTSADHTSCPYSFVFFECLIGKAGKEVFPTAKTKYLAQSLCRHLATLCRQYNDYGSVVRDRAEGNLNAVDFPEFGQEVQGLPHYSTNGEMCGNEQASTGVDVHTNGLVEPGSGAIRDFASAQTNGNTGVTWEQRKKAALLWLAEYERSCLELTRDRLAGEISSEVMEALKLFINVTDLYGQIYVARDIGVWTK